MKYLLHLPVIYQLIFAILAVLIIGLFLSQHTTFNPVLLVVYILIFIFFGYWSLQFAFKKNIAQKSIKADIDTRDFHFSSQSGRLFLPKKLQIFNH